MIKRMLYFGNPYYLSTTDQQLVIKKKGSEIAVRQPIEDVGYLVLDHPQITISFTAIERLIDNNVALIYCNQKHMPHAMLTPLVGHNLQQKRVNAQVNALEPLKKRLWKQTVQRKISNQASVLEMRGINASPMHRWAKEVRSGDTSNKEAQASRYYWSHIFKDFVPDFIRDRYGFPPNNLLNYGYAILRAAVARALVGAGLSPFFGIHHHNQYNPFCLADDIMEPYRPFVDRRVLILLDSVQDIESLEEVTTDIKQSILEIVHVDTQIKGMRSPLMIALNKTASSLAKCYLQNESVIHYPTLI